MSHQGELADWLRSVAAGAHGWPVAFPDARSWPADVAPGDIRAARDMDRRSETRLALLLNVEESPFPWVTAVLLTPSIETATDRDLYLAKTDTSLPFDLLAQTDIPAPLMLVQLGPRVGGINAETLLKVNRAVGGGSIDPAAGIPLIESADPRWQFREEETAGMQRLGANALVQLAFCESHEVPMIADSTIIDLDSLSGERGGELLLSLLELATTSAMHIPGSHVVDADALIHLFPDGVALPDVDRALAPLLNVVLVGCRDQDVPGRRVDWGDHHVPMDRLAATEACIVACAGRGERAVQLVTLDPSGERRRRGYGPSIAGVGVVQITEWSLGSVGA